MIAEETISIKKVWQVLGEICDPEIPVLSIIDLGIVRDVIIKDNIVEVIITPTYSGCPAMDAIALNIRLALVQNGFNDFKITQILSPAWTTDWMTENGKQKLKSYGIAPPQSLSDDIPSDRINRMLFSENILVECPQCRSHNTKLLSQFGSTSCKALYQCNDCKEPFDYFKCH